MCAEHALDGMVNVVTKRYGHPYCRKHPSYGMAGSNKREMSAQHAVDGMVDITRGRPAPVRGQAGGRSDVTRGRPRSSGQLRRCDSPALLREVSSGGRTGRRRRGCKLVRISRDAVPAEEAAAEIRYGGDEDGMSANDAVKTEIEIVAGKAGSATRCLKVRKLFGSR